MYPKKRVLKIIRAFTIKEDEIRKKIEAESTSGATSQQTDQLVKDVIEQLAVLNTYTKGLVRIPSTLKKIDTVKILSEFDYAVEENTVRQHMSLVTKAYNEMSSIIGWLLTTHENGDTFLVNVDSEESLENLEMDLDDAYRLLVRAMGSHKKDEEAYKEIGDTEEADTFFGLYSSLSKVVRTEIREMKKHLARLRQEGSIR